jgi:hypothetical protein
MRRAAQALTVEKVRRVDEFAQAVALIGRLLGECLLAQFNPRAFRQAAHRLAERQPLDAHQERECIARRAAPEAVESVQRGANMERGRFFGVERAESLEVPACPFQSHIVGDQFNEIDAVSDCLAQVAQVGSPP